MRFVFILLASTVITSCGADAGRRSADASAISDAGADAYDPMGRVCCDTPPGEGGYCYGTFNCESDSDCVGAVDPDGVEYPYCSQ